jgi:septal ring factor EnvC (AmiA/AmiB activator)
MALERFEKLEKGLKRLLASIEPLETENTELKNALGLKDLEIKRLKQRLKKLEGEKGVVRQRVDQLLKKLDGLVQGV